MLRYLPVYVCALLLTACGSSHLQVVDKSLTLEQALAQVDALTAQPGTDNSGFTRLKQALRSSLRASGVTRFTSAVPGGAAGTVSDLKFASDGGDTLLVWTYANRADYDQNSQVNIADLSTLGANLGKGSSSPDWLTKSQAADGDGNGLVTISDITPIGSSLLATVDGYWVQSSTTPSDAGSWSDLAQVVFQDAALEAGSPIKQFSFVLDSPQPGTFYRVRPYNGEELGPVSNYVQLGDGPPEITAVQPQSGAPGAVVQFAATLDGSPVSDYAWDFGGGAVPDTTIDPSPMVTLGAAGSYSASLTVTGDLGSDTYDFTLNVVPSVTPPHIEDVQPRSGYGNGGHVTFTATLSGGAPDTYAWDFGAPGGEISPNTSSDPAPDVALGALGAYNASLTVGNAGGTDTFNFVFNITTMPTAIAAPVNLRATDGDYDDHVHLTWEADPGDDTPEAYIISRATGAGGPYTVLTTTNSLNYDDVPPTQNTLYWYQVVARKTDRLDSQPSLSDSGYAYAFSPAAAWHAAPVPGGAETNYYLPILIDCNGKPAIGRYAPNQAQHYAQWFKAKNMEGSSWNDPLELSDSTYGHFADLAVIGGKPALLLLNDTPSGTYFKPALDADGTNWDTPKQVSQGTFIGAPLLSEIGGHPACSYGEPNEFLMIANDTAGTSWPNSGFAIGQHSTFSRLAFFPDGRPMCCANWVDTGVEYCEFLYAQNPDGTSWLSVPVTSEPVSGHPVSLNSVFYSAGRPWLGLQRYKSSGNTIGTMFATDANGLSWPGTETVIPKAAPSANQLVDLGFAVVNGRPCAVEARSDSSAEDVLWFEEAVDNLGTSWKPAVMVDSGEIITHPCLIGIGTPQRPAVSYYAGQPRALRFAERY